MTLDALSLRLLRRSLLDPVSDTLGIWRRLHENGAFRSYLYKRRLRALPLAAGAVLTSLTLTAAVAIYLMSANSALGVLVMLAVVPIVLIGSFWVQAHALLSWLEERSLVRLLPAGRSRDRGPVNRWLVRRYRIDLGPAPDLLWIPALVFFVLPAAALVRVSAPGAAAVAAYLLAAVIFYAARDRVGAAPRAPEKRRPAPAAPAPAQTAHDPDGTGALDFTAPRPRWRLSGAIGRVRASVASGVHGVHSWLGSLGRLVLLNIPPFVEYAVLGAGIFFAASGRLSGSGDDEALGIALVGAALLFAGVVSIVTQRVSFRFFSGAGAGHGGATARITGMMQLVAGGLAVAAAQAIASGTWNATLQALLTNPWPLLIPLGLLAIGAGLLLVRWPDGHFGPVSVLLLIVPRALVGIVVLCGGVAILLAWAWMTYDARTFQSFLHLFLEEQMRYLEAGWRTAISWLR